MDDFDLGYYIDNRNISRVFPDDGVTDSQLAQHTVNSLSDLAIDNGSSQESRAIPEVIFDGSQEVRRIDTYRDFGVFNTSSTANPAELEQERFADVSEQDIEAYAAGNVNANTKHCTEWGERVYNRWRETYGHHHSGQKVPRLAEMDREKVKKWIPLFIIAARTKEGHSYPHGSLHALACALKRRMVELKIPDINYMNQNDTDFKQVRDVLDRRMKEVTAEGIGVHRKQAKGISEAEEQEMWDRGIFGMHDATSLQNTVFYYLTKIFALRGGAELRQGGKCTTFHGGLNQLKQQPKTVTHISPHGSDPCIVSILLTYIDAIGRTDPFSRKPLKSEAGQQYRFSAQAIGHNSLSKKMAEICKSAGFTGFYTNHSGRRTIASQMFNAGLDEQLIMDRTGHRSVQGVRAYKQTHETTVVKVSTLVGPPSKTPRLRQSSLDDFSPPSNSHASDAIASASGINYPTRKDKELLYSSTPKKRAARPQSEGLIDEIPSHGAQIQPLNFDIGISSGNALESDALTAPPVSASSSTGNRADNIMKSLFNANVIKYTNIHIHFH